MELLDVKEVSELLKVKTTTLYAWAAQGKIPCVRLNGLLRFEQRDLEQWLKAHRAVERQFSHNPAKTRDQGNVDALIARAKQEVYTTRRGETRPKSSLIRKEEWDGAV